MQARACTPPRSAQLGAQALRQQLTMEIGPGVGIACGAVDGDPEMLWPVERAAIINAVPRRQQEFAAGRAAAREAMNQIGWPAECIPSSTDRSPVWPKGLVGSIAHNGQVCVAVTGRHDQIHALGIDVEENLSMDPALWKTICTPEEWATLEALPKSVQGHWVTRLFCAKEAFYKWQYPQTQQMLDFGDVQIAPSRNGLGFRVLAAASGNSRLLLCKNEGRLMLINGLVLAWLIGPPTAQS